MNILVTGSEGYVGKRAVMHALEEGHRVRGFDRKFASMQRGTFEHFTGDITNLDQVRQAVTETEAVFHCAAALAQFVRDEATMTRVNVEGTANVLQAAHDAGVQKVVFLSSVEVYGIDVPVPCTEDQPLVPICRYGHDKVECEKLCEDFQGRGLDVTVFRPPTVNGPGQNEPFLVEQMVATRKGKATILPGGGNTRLQMVHVDDLVRAMMMALHVPSARGLVCNISSDNVPTLRELSEALYRHAGKKPKFVNVPAGVARFAVKTLSLLGISPLEPQHLEIALRDYMFDNTRAKRELGWYPQKDDIQATIDAYDFMFS